MAEQVMEKQLREEIMDEQFIKEVMEGLRTLLLLKEEVRAVKKEMRVVLDEILERVTQTMQEPDT